MGLELLLLILFVASLLDVRLAALLAGLLLLLGNLDGWGRRSIWVLDVVALGAKLIVELGDDVQQGLVLLEAEGDSL